MKKCNHGYTFFDGLLKTEWIVSFFPRWLNKNEWKIVQVGKRRADYIGFFAIMKGFFILILSLFSKALIGFFAPDLMLAEPGKANFAH